MQDTLRTTRRTGPLAVPVLLTLVAALAALTGCERHSAPIEAPPPDAAAAAEGEFASHAELWRAVRSGSYAERADLPLDELTAAALPEPVEIAFVRGTRPPDEELSALDALVERLKDDDGLSVDLIGCSDPTGPAALNRRISHERAEAVAEALRQRGAPAASVDQIIGRGEACEVQERVVQVIPERAGS